MRLLVVLVLLGGHARVRMPVSADGATITTAEGSMTVIASSIAGGDDLRDRFEREPDLGCVRIERLAVVRSGAAYGGGPQWPKLVGGNALVYVAYAATDRGDAAVLRFYVDERGFDHARDWVRLAREIALTLELYPDAGPIRRRPPEVVMPHTVTSLHGRCDILDEELDVSPTAPERADHVVGVVRGEPAFWSTWSDGHGQYAELITGAERWGSLVVRCSAGSERELQRLRANVEAALP